MVDINTYVWNLGKWYWWTYLRGRDRDRDTENRCVDTAGNKRVGWIGRLELTYICYHVQNRELVGTCCVVQGTQLCALWWPRWVGWRMVVKGRPSPPPRAGGQLGMPGGQAGALPNSAFLSRRRRVTSQARESQLVWAWESLAKAPQGAWDASAGWIPAPYHFNFN